MKHVLSERQLYDLEMIMNGGFHPLKGFMIEKDYLSVVDELRLSMGNLFPIPIILDISESFKNKLKICDTLILQDQNYNPLAELNVESIYKPNKTYEAEKVFGSPDDINHPAINYLLNETKEWYVGGVVTKINDPIHLDYENLRKTASQLKKYFKKRNIEKIIGFQTRNPMHKSHFEITKLGLKSVPNSHLLIHPVVGLTKPGDIDPIKRVKCYIEIQKYYDNTPTLSLLPLAMRMAGPREALWHAIIRKNYGCTHFIVGRDHAGPGKNKNGDNFYGIYDAQKLAKKHANEIGIEILTFSDIGYIEELGEYRELNKVENIEMYTVKNLSGTELRRRIKSGEYIPDWFTFPSILKYIQNMGGVTLFLTGLSGAGKTTLAEHLKIKLSEITDKPITILDGDEVRQNLTKGLGFSKEDRDTNVKRVGYVASLINKNGGIAIISAIAPYKKARDWCRKENEKYGKFIEIYVSTPLSTCEDRDVKGLYKSARLGNIKNFTGISDPYEIPLNSDIFIDTSKYTIKESINLIISNI